MKLQLQQEFELEIFDKIYTGIFKDLTRKQQKEIDDLLPDAEVRKLNKLNRKLRIAQTEEDKVKLEEDIEKVQEALAKKDTDNFYKKRLELSIFGDDKKDIMRFGDEYNYKMIYEAIRQDIAERREKN